MPYKYRESNDIDIEMVVDLLFEVKMLKDVNKKNTYTKALSDAFSNSQYVVSVWDRKTLVGFARVITDTSLFATIWNLTVKPSYQNKGIGKELIKRCLENYPHCHFFLIADKEVTQFYEKLGFEIHNYGMYLKEGRKRCVIYT